MKKILVVVLFLVGAAAAAFFLFKSQADKDTANITKLDETKVSKEKLDELAKGKSGDLRTVMQAAQQAGDMKADDKLKLWQTQLASDNPAVRLKALQELAALAREKNQAALDLIRKTAAEDKDEDVKMMAEMLVEELTAAPAEGGQK
jgi:uncharacterized protein YxeA